MDIERAIEFLVRNQGQMDTRFDAKFDRADKRLERLERVVADNNRVVAQNNRIVTRLARYGVSLRDDVRRLDRVLAVLAERHTETDDKLNGLIEIVRLHLRGNGQNK